MSRLFQQQKCFLLFTFSRLHINGGKHWERRLKSASSQCSGHFPPDIANLGVTISLFFLSDTITTSSRKSNPMVATKMKSVPISEHLLPVLALDSVGLPGTTVNVLAYDLPLKLLWNHSSTLEPLTMKGRKFY